MELLVVLALVGLLLALAVPVLSNAFPGAALRGATRDIAAALRASRSQAVTQNREVAFTLDLRSRKYAISGDPRVRTLPAGFDLAMRSARPEAEGGFVGRIYFFPDGSSTGGRITLRRGERVHNVKVDWLLGRITIAD